MDSNTIRELHLKKRLQSFLVKLHIYEQMFTQSFISQNRYCSYFLLVRILAGTKPPKFFNPPLFVHKSYRLNDALGNGLSTPFFVQKTCHQYTIRAAKTIRVQHAIALEKFLDKDVWVIHLVRDPRAIIVSRKLATGYSNHNPL